MADLNARIGSTPSPAFGLCEASLENSNGSELRMTCEEHGLAAVNSFWAAGHTWTSSYGTTARIDYVLCSRRVLCKVAHCTVLSGIDLATAERDDHRVLSCYWEGLLDGICDSKPEQISAINRIHGAPKFDAASLCDPARRYVFQQLLLQSSPAQLAQQCQSTCRQAIDDVEASWMKAVHSAANAAFTRQTLPTRKPWISCRTWSLVRSIGRVRGLVRATRHARMQLELAVMFSSWRCVSRSAAPPRHDAVRGHADCPAVTLGPTLLGAVGGISKQLDIRASMLSKALVLLCRLRRPLVRRDKQAALEKKADEAQRAANTGDSKKVYAIARGLAGASAAPIVAIRSEAGDVLTDSEQIKDRWRSHFSDVFRATGAPSVADVAALQQMEQETAVGFLERCAPRKRRRCKQAVFAPTVDQVHSVILRINGDNGLGPDQCSAHVLQAGSWVIAAHIHQLICWALAHDYIPVAWRGGKLVVLYKGKGSPQEVDSYRGLLVSSHVSKVLTSLLQEHLADAYVRQIGTCQFGAVARRGTSLAILALRCFLDMCALQGRSAFVLFVDLSKAFDYAIREVALGWLEGAPPDRPGQLRHFLSLGLDLDIAEALVDLITAEGSLFEQLGVCSEASSMARSLHTGAWFMLPGDTEVLVSRCGGRQGCKLGALLFNMIYSVALRRVARSLIGEGIALHVPTAGMALWGPRPNSQPSWTPVHSSDIPLVELTYVDDEALLLSARSPAALLSAQASLLSHVCTVFRSMGFVINWKAGKSECFLIFRGKRAAEHRRRFPPDHSSLPLPSICGSEHLRVVDQYKYLGSKVTCDNSVIPDAAYRVQRTMLTYGPLAGCLFGSSRISRSLRQSLASSLCWSRLLHAVATWTRMPRRAYVMINACYMRVLGRIVGKIRHSSSTRHRDADVRAELLAPSLQALISRRRLQLLASVLRGDVPMLPALLAVSIPGTKHNALPWIELVVNDMCELQRALRPKLDELGDPWMNAENWCAFIVQWPAQWAQLLKSYAPCSTPADDAALASRMPKCGSQVTFLKHCCSDCPASFHTAKALQQHRRVAHGARMDARRYVSGASACPVCGVTFSCRPKVLAHLAEARQRGKDSGPSCRDQLMSGRWAPLPDGEVASLDLQDRALRASARKRGWTQPRSNGRVSRPPKRGLVVSAAPDHLPCKRLTSKTSRAEVHWSLKRLRFS